MLSLAYKPKINVTVVRYKVMILSIKAIRNEFNAACAGGCVYGRFQGQSRVYVYAELGQEKSYLPKPSDDPKTNYRLFINCDVFFAESEEQLNSGFFATEIFNSTVVIYC